VFAAFVQVLRLPPGLVWLLRFAVVAQDDEFCWLVAERAATASAAFVPVLRLPPGWFGS